MAADETNEKSLDTKTDASATQYKPEADDLKSSYASRAEELGTAQAKRVTDYLEDKVRDTSSWSILKDLRMSIIDSGVSILRKGLSMLSGNPEKTEEAAGDDMEPQKPAEASGDGKGGNGAPEAGKGTANPTELGGDWIDNMVDLAVQRGANPEALPLGVLDDARKLIPEGGLDPNNIPLGVPDALKPFIPPEAGDLDPNHIPLGVLDMLPKGASPLEPSHLASPEALPLGVPDDARKLASSDHAPKAPAESAEEGKIGDRSKDSGVATLEKPEITTTKFGERDLPTEYKMPDGQTYQIEYDDKGQPSAITMPDAGGREVRYENQNGIWKDPDGQYHGDQISSAKVDENGRLLIMSNVDGVDKAISISADGTFISYKDYQTNQPESMIEADGKVTQYKSEGTAVTEALSHVTEIKSGDTLKGYEVKDDQGHVKTITKEEGGVIVKTGDRVEKYADVQPDGKGGLKLIGKMEPDEHGGFKPADKSTVELGPDGTEVHKNEKNQVTSITNSDGETTTFERSGNAVTGVTVTNGEGKVVEHSTGKVEIKDDGSYTIALPQADLDARKADGAEGTPVKLERKRDGTEQLLDKEGKHVDSDADKLAGKIDMTPEQRQQLKQDLADIDKLPPEQRQKVYDSLSKIADTDTYNLVEKETSPGRFTNPERTELVTSLAHNIAHPESIQQGAHNSCAAANMEGLMARTHPDRYADMVSKLATEGEYHCPPPSDKVVKADTHNGRLDSKADVWNRRSISSELFQDAAIQLAVYPKTYKSLPLDSTDIEPRPKGVTPATDLGDRISDPNNPDAPPERLTGLDDNKQLQAYKELFPDDKYGNRPINSPEELQKAYDDNGPPLKVGISLKGDHAKTGMGDGGGPGSDPGNHAVTITKIENGKVYYENTAGGQDHSYPNGEGVPIAEFTEAIKTAEKGAFVKGKESKSVTSSPEGSRGEEGKIGAPSDKSGDAGSDTAALKRLKDDPEVKEHHQKLVDAAKDMKEPQKTEFLKNLDKFENRAAGLEKDYQKQFEAQGMKPEDAEKAAEKKAQEQVENSYKNIERLLEENDKAPVSQEDRVILAQQGLEHAADTTTISQGNHNTCFAAASETRTFAKDPAEATRMIADVATTGKYTTSGQNPVTIDYSDDKFSLHKQGESNEIPRKDGHRDFASQIFEVTAANVILEQRNQLTQPPGKLRYEQHEDRSGAKPPDDSGDRVIDYSQTPPSIVNYGSGFNAPEIAGMLKEVSPKSSEGITNLTEPADHKRFSSTLAANEELMKFNFEEAGMKDDLNLDITDPARCRKMHEAIDKKKGLTDDQRKELHQNVNDVAAATYAMRPHGDAYPGDDPERMKMFLAEAKRKGELPIIVAVECDQEPFWTDSGAGKAGGSGGGHVVTITDFDETTGKVKMQNQWEKANNHEMSLEDLCKATTTTNEHKLEVMKEQVEKNRRENKVDYALEHKTLELQKKAGELSEGEYNEKRLAVLQKWSDQDHRAGKSNPDVDFALTSLKHSTGKISDQQYMADLEKQSAEFRKAGAANYTLEYNLLDVKHKLGKISDDEYDKQLVAMTAERQKERLKYGDDPPEQVSESYAKGGRTLKAMIDTIKEKDPKRAEKLIAEIRKKS